MKILFIQKEGGIFGAEQFQLRTIPELISRGVSVDFLRLYTDHQLGIDSPFTYRLREMGANVYQVRIGKIPMRRDLFEVKSIIEKGAYDAVHTHLIHADFYGALVKRLLLPKMCLVSTKHGYEEWYNNKHGFDPSHRKKNLYWRMCRFSESQVNASFAISDGLHRFFVESGISDPDKISRIHYGFNFDDQKEVSPIPKIGYPQLVLAGRLVGFKGHRYAIRAVEKLKAKYPEIHLWVLGTGELEEELKASVISKGLTDQVSFLGYKTNVAAYMNGADVVLIPSIAEGFGVVTMEAIQQKRPIAAFNVPAANEILPKPYHTFMAEPFEVDDYADKVAFIVENSTQMTHLLEEALNKLYSYFTVERMVGEMLTFYNKTIK